LKISESKNPSGSGVLKSFKEQVGFMEKLEVEVGYLARFFEML
jgi:hypothetical protein